MRRQISIGYFVSPGSGMTEASGNIDAACFYLTHAYVFALEIGAPEEQDLHARLKRYGRAH